MHYDRRSPEQTSLSRPANKRSSYQKYPYDNATAFLDTQPRKLVHCNRRSNDFRILP